MTRSFIVVISAFASALALGPAFLQGCKATGVGDPCTPEQEYDPSFNEFDEQEANVEAMSFQCQTRLCLVNHFRGRVTCPYGQDETGQLLPDHTPFTGDAKACSVPGSDTPITGNQASKTKALVRAECTDRTADKTVYCSCRCANLDGRTDDGANYCTCPDGFACTQLVPSDRAGDTGLAGAYCIKDNTQYDRASACASTCDPASSPCK